ncbi:MAG TPA: class I SAM-dependent methyltransferase, partial [Thermoleophilaceae bacterium]|nr:class I SAM-dependent methyltransferase [Thermoleophilaceae bacterium]
MSGTPPDWGLGTYERTAEQLMPAAQAVVASAAPAAGERVVDVGCGTGNAALIAAERGARVTGVDPAT